MYPFTAVIVSEFLLGLNFDSDVIVQLTVFSRL